MKRFLTRLWPLMALFVLAGCSSYNNKLAVSGERISFWDHYFVGPLSDLLDWIAKLLWGQYGLAILVLTLIVRFAILPLTIKQYRSSKAMQALQPELKKLKEKYKDDARKQQEETMKLFQQNGVNPLSGCFPLLIQSPVFIVLYQSIMRNPDLSHHTFLWLQLGEKDHYYILPVIAAMTTFLQQRVMKTQMNPQMQAMMFIFPVLIFVMAMNFASALPLYWIFSNTFTIVQSYLLYRPGKTPAKSPSK